MKRRGLLFLLTMLALACNNPGDAQSLRVMSFNIRYDNPADGENAWAQRKHRVASTLHFFDVEVAGLQEMLHHQVMQLDSALTAYNWIGVGRDDGAKAGEYAPIFYQTDRLAPLETGTFWLSPETARPTGPAWDAACTRIATWGRFQDRCDGTELLIINTHFDHVGTVARQKSAMLIHRFADSTGGGAPVLLLGDFNCTTADSAYGVLTGEAAFTDCRTISTTLPYGSTDSFNAFKNQWHPGRQIDFIFGKNIGKVRRYGIIADRWDGQFVSDHHAVLAEIHLE